jgi:hypothetical protein
MGGVVAYTLGLVHRRYGGKMTVQELIDALAAGVRDGLWLPDANTTVDNVEDIVHIWDDEVILIDVEDTDDLPDTKSA